MGYRPLGLLLLFFAISSQAATFTVTNLADSGPGSLRDALNQANALPDADIVNFGVTGTIVLTTGQISIFGPVTITGPGAANLIIDGNANNRIFLINDPAPPACPALTGPVDHAVTISGLTLRNAHRSSSDTSGGAISSVHSLTLDSMVIRDNAAKQGAGVALFMQYPGQTLTINNTQFIDNVAKPLFVPTTGTTQGGAVHVGELCTGTRTTPVAVNITNSLFSGNRVQPVLLNGRGGAITFGAYVDATITDSRIIGNGIDPPVTIPPGMTYQGGAISGSPKSLRIERTEITGNSAVSVSAILISQSASDLQTPATAAAVDIVNSTISGNAATGGSAAVVAFGNVRLQFYNSTIAHNTAIATATSGIIFNTGATNPPTASNALAGTLKLASSIVWNPGTDNRDIGVSATILAQGPLVVDSTNSLVGAIRAYEGEVEINGAGNKLGLDPMLAPLAFNGGTTRTHALTTASQAIDAGSNPLGLSVDQRSAGNARVQGDAADMGAFEHPASCAGFTDVATGPGFCANTGWLKNRAVTLGCSAGLYCPGSNVIRLAMAAFMNRLGTALILRPAGVQEVIGALDPDGSANFFCLHNGVNIAEVPATAHPRRAYVDAVFTGIAPGDVGLAVELVATTDWGSSVQSLGTSLGTLRANKWGQVRALGHIDIDGGKPLLAAVVVSRGGLPGVGTLSDSSCNLRVRVDNRNGTSAPFDATLWNETR